MMLESKGVSAKDIILALIARIGIGGGTEHVFEYTGSAIRGLSRPRRRRIRSISCVRATSGAAP